MNKTAQISVQTFFFILMGIFFIWILIFGYNQITNMNDQISNQEKIIIEKDLKDALDYCEDPLNKGSTKLFSIKHKDVRGVCVINSSISIPSSVSNLSSKIIGIFNAGDNVILLNDKDISGSFKIESDIKESKCFFYNEKKGETLISFKC